MARFLAPIALALTVAFTGAAFAGSNDGIGSNNGLAISASNGTLTPHGLWDAR